jgi:hypothetical protein
MYTDQQIRHCARLFASTASLSASSFHRFPLCPSMRFQVVSASRARHAAQRRSHSSRFLMGHRIRGRDIDARFPKPPHRASPSACADFGRGAHHVARPGVPPRRDGSSLPVLRRGATAWSPFRCAPIVPRNRLRGDRPATPFRSRPSPKWTSAGASIASVVGRRQRATGYYPLPLPDGRGVERSPTFD